MPYLDELSRKNRRGGADSDSEDAPQPDPDEPSGSGVGKKGKKAMTEMKDLHVLTRNSKSGDGQLAQAGSSNAWIALSNVIERENRDHWENLEYFDATVCVHLNIPSSY